MNHPNSKATKSNSVRYKYVIVLTLSTVLIVLIQATRINGNNEKNSTASRKLRTTRKSLPLENSRRAKSALAPVLRQNFQNDKTSAVLLGNQVDKRDYYDPISTSKTNEQVDDGSTRQNDGTDREDLRAETQLSFSLMNSSKDRIAAVKSLLQNETASIGQLQSNKIAQANDSSVATLAINQSSGQCNHKGRIYANGQLVPIEEQPCLSCTCLRSIMQCFLRVCPPVVSSSASADMSTNSHKSSASDSPLKCRMVKELQQCCPTMKCDSVNNQQQTTSTTTATNPTIESPPKNQTIRRGTGEASRAEIISGQHLGSADSSLKDSILLISSNPAHHEQAKHQAASMQLQNMSVNLSERALSRAMSRYDYSSSLLDALIESAYSNAAQMNGFNVAGSCLINGSLYVEGSAVLTEANSFCQFCYCIRQKIMCVRPKCQLYISGCKAKYGSEYACCPTSYECATTNSNSQLNSLLQDTNSSSVSALSPHHSNVSGSKELVSKISAALESISRLTQMERLHNAELSGRRDLDARAETHSQNKTLSLNKQAENDSTGLMEAIMRTVSEQVEGENAPGTLKSDALDEQKGANFTPNVNAGILERTNEAINSNETSEANESKSDSNEQETATTTTSTTTSAPPSDELLEPMNKLGPHTSTGGQAGGVGACMDSGRQYEIGEQIPTLDRCKHCYCGLDGTKECKIVECSLKMAHDCKPIIPKDHCCPIRYECPNSQHHLNGTSTSKGQHNQAHFNHNSTQLAQRNSLADSLREAMNRYRSEQLGVELSSQAADFNTSSPFQEAPFTTQCSIPNGANSSTPNCSPNNNQQMVVNGASSPSPANAARQANGMAFNWPSPTGPLELIPGLGDYAPPTQQLKFGAEPRLVGEQTDPLTITTLNKMLENFTKSPEANSISGSDINLQQNQFVAANPTLITQITTMQPEFFANSTMRNGVNSGSISATLDSANMQNLAQDLNKFMMNINASSQHQNGTNNDNLLQMMQLQLQLQSTRAPLSPMAVHNQQPRMAADYHSVQAEPEHLRYNLMAPSGNETNATNELVTSPPLQAIGIPSIEPELIGNLARTDHMSLVHGSNDPNDRTTDNPQPSQFNGPILEDKLAESFVEYARPTATTSGQNNIQMESMTANPLASIDRDDNDLSRSLNSGDKPKMIFDPNQAQSGPSSTPNSVVFDDDAAKGSDSNPAQGSDENLSSRQDYSTTTSSAFITPLADHQYESTPFPPQPSTGTPLGIEEPTTANGGGARDKGWFRSLTGLVVNHFGRRLNGSRQLDRSEPLESSQSDSQASDSAQVSATARSSSGQTIFKQLLDKFVGSGESSWSPSSSFSGRSMSAGATSGLIMRPLSTESRSSEQHLNADLNLSSSSDLVTSSIPFTPEINVPDVKEPQTFSHRSLTSSLEDSDARMAPISDNSSEEQLSNGAKLSVNGAEQLGMQMISSDARLAATCLDPITNATYQSGEKMARNDSCLACTCVSGEPLCSPLVCPPKPAENCYEDKQAHIGECCPSYVCTDNASQFRSQQLNQIHVSAGKQQHSARMISQHPNQQVLNLNPLQRLEPKLTTNNNNNNNINGIFQLNKQTSRITAENMNRLQVEQLGRNPLISATGLFRSLPAHLRYPPQKNALILPSLATVESTSTILQQTPQNKLNNIPFQPAINTNNNNNLIWPTEINPNHVNKRLMQPIIAEPDVNANRQIVQHPSLHRQSPVDHPAATTIRSYNNHFKNPIWWNSLNSRQQTTNFNPIQMSRTTATSSISNPMQESQNAPESVKEQRLVSSIETQLAAESESRSEPRPLSTFATSDSQFSPVADSEDPTAMKPLAKPVAAPLAQLSIKERDDNVMSIAIEPSMKPAPAATTTVSNDQSGTVESVELGSGFDTNDKNQSSSIESLALNPFQVSRCDVSGKLYRIGETIESLSDRCKQCVCTPIGVDCQTRLC